MRKNDNKIAYLCPWYSRGFERQNEFFSLLHSYWDSFSPPTITGAPEA